MNAELELKRTKALRAAGYWTDEVFEEFLQRAASATPDKKAIVAHRADRDAFTTLTFRELEDEVSRVAGALRALGVERGDVVAVQLPNWWEFAAVHLACGRLGAAFCPLMPILRERELLFILGLCEAKVFVVPKVFRGHDFAAMARGMRTRLPKLQYVVVVDEDGPDGFEQRLRNGGAPLAAPKGGSGGGLGPEELAVLMLTSGTTGEPKGVMHNSCSLVSSANGIAKRLELTQDDVVLIAAPLPHMLGFAAGWLVAVRLGATMVMQDVWDPKRGIRLIQSEGVTYTAGSTPFLSDVCDASAATGIGPAGFRSYLCAGAPIPSALVERALTEMNLKVCSAWGMTEVIAGTVTEPGRAAEKSPKADGRALDGMEVRVVDFTGKTLSTGVTGRLLVRGAQRAMGYYKRPNLMVLDEEGWLDSGDLAHMDSESYIRVAGRTKDVLIRGGENVPIVEIENLLYKHPAVSSVAIVGFPDRRLGERACAFIVTRPGKSIDLPEVHRYLAETKTAKQYWPERVELVNDLPRTPTGKVQKFVLRDVAKKFGDAQ